MSDPRDPMTAVLAEYRRSQAIDFAHAWAGLEPTFQTAKSVGKWQKLSAEPGGEDAYFEDEYMLDTQKRVAKEIERRYREQRAEGRPHCMFASVEREADADPWGVKRQNLIFRWEDAGLEPFEVRLGLDPETFEFSIKPVPIAWFYDERFVAFLDEYCWRVPQELGLSCSMAHGGAQFSLSAKSFLSGSLLADEIATRTNHPELASWILDWPNPDDRAFRATGPRLAAFRRILDDYWAGRFHPRATGVPTVENALLDRGFEPAARASDDLVDPLRGPAGDEHEVFQTNFAFGRSVRLRAQSVHPGYWQSAHPDEDGYRPDQIMRYGEANLNRLQIAGELHVKSGKVLDDQRVPPLDAPLEISHLATEASFEDRAQMSRTSARDFVEALLLRIHHARHLQAHPHVTVVDSLLQDQLLGDAGETIRRRGGGAMLARLRADARKSNREVSRGRVQSDWIEPETLFWAAWRALPAGEKAAVAREAIGGFLEYVECAAAHDPRPIFRNDPLEWHRHRVHPTLWRALGESPGDAGGALQRELRIWREREPVYLSRRPRWSQLDGTPAPWDVAHGT